MTSSSSSSNLKTNCKDHESSIGDDYEDNQDNEQQEHHEDSLARRENRAVARLRVVAACVMIIVAVSVCIGVYIMSTAAEKADFEQDFAELGQKIVDSFGFTLQQRLGVVNNFGMSLTSYASQQKVNNVTSWPFVTLPDYAYRAGNSAQLADLMSLAAVCFVADDQREEWEHYASTHQDWMFEGMALRGEGDAVEPISETLIAPLHGGGGMGLDTTTGPYAAHWQAYPATPKVLINLNMYAHPHYTKPVHLLRGTGKPVFPPSYDFIDPVQRAKDPRRPMIQSFIEVYESVNNAGVKYEEDAILALMYPGKYEKHLKREQPLLGRISRDFFLNVILISSLFKCSIDSTTRIPIARPWDF